MTRWSWSDWLTIAIQSTMEVVSGGWGGGGGGEEWISLSALITPGIWFVIQWSKHMMKDCPSFKSTFSFDPPIFWDNCGWFFVFLGGGVFFKKGSIVNGTSCNKSECKLSLSSCRTLEAVSCCRWVLRRRSAWRAPRWGPRCASLSFCSSCAPTPAATRRHQHKLPPPPPHLLPWRWTELFWWKCGDRSWRGWLLVWSSICDTLFQCLLWWWRNGQKAERALYPSPPPPPPISFYFHFELPAAEVSLPFTPHPSAEVSPSFTPHPSVEVSPSFTPHPSVEVSPPFTLHPSVEVSPSFTLHPSVEVSPSFTPHPSVEVSPSFTPHPSAEVSPSFTPHPSVEVSPPFTPHPSAEVSPPFTPHHQLRSAHPSHHQLRSAHHSHCIHKLRSAHHSHHIINWGQPILHIASISNCISSTLYSCGDRNSHALRSQWPRTEVTSHCGHHPHTCPRNWPLLRCCCFIWCRTGAVSLAAEGLRCQTSRTSPTHLCPHLWQLLLMTFATHPHQATAPHAIRPISTSFDTRPQGLPQHICLYAWGSCYLWPLWHTHTRQHQMASVRPANTSFDTRPQGLHNTSVHMLEAVVYDFCNTPSSSNIRHQTDLLDVTSLWVQWVVVSQALVESESVFRVTSHPLIDSPCLHVRA